MANLYQYKDSNIRKTYFLFTIFFIGVIGLGWIFSFVFEVQWILPFAVIFSIVSAFISYWYSDKIALAMSHSVPIKKRDNSQLYNIVENLCITAGLPTPNIYITPEMQINAFATGRDPEHAAISVTQGALEKLGKQELEGVLAHELSHIGNRDILISTVAVVLAGMISLMADFFMRSTMFFGGFGRNRNERNDNSEFFILIGIILSILAPIGAMLIQLAISRKRESLADASGVLLTRYPDGLINALRKIQIDNAPMAVANSATAHLWIANPYKNPEKTPWYHKIFMTHPPIEERINNLKQIKV